MWRPYPTMHGDIILKSLNIPLTDISIAENSNDTANLATKRNPQLIIGTFALPISICTPVVAIVLTHLLT